jgi:hypothetical protein
MQAVYIELGIFVIVIIGLLLVYPRLMSQGKILCIFDEGGKTKTRLLKEDKVENCVWIGKVTDSKREEYIIDVSKLTYTSWPGGLPSMFQVEVRTLKFVRGNSAPYNSKGQIDKGITAQYLAIASNVKMLEARFNDMRAALGQKFGKGGKYELFILIGVAVLVVVGIYSVMLNMQMQKQLKIVYDTLMGVTAK